VIDPCGCRNFIPSGFVSVRFVVGHKHLVRLPGTKKWNEVVELLVEGAELETIAAAAADAAESSLPRASKDPALVRAFWLLTQIPLAARTEDFSGSLRRLGVEIGPSPSLIEVVGVVGQRIVGIALGYEDVNDHDELRYDPVLALFAEKLEPKRPDCAPLAGKSTLNRLEHAPLRPDDRYHKIGHDPAGLANLFVDLFLEAQPRPPKQIVLDLDATDDPLHGQQEGRFFHGYYSCYCYLPLYVFCGRHLLAARLRPSNIDASAGAVEEVARIIARVRAAWPRVRILLRADSGFARDELMAWCEANRVDYVFGLARNPRLVSELEGDLAKAAAAHAKTGQPARRFKEFFYATLDSWRCARRVIGKAEHLAKGPNPRFIVTSLPAAVVDGRVLYERVYCARGDMENRIKEQLGRRNGVGAPFPNRATKRPVCGSHVGSDHARQPTPSLVCVLRLRAARGLAAHWPTPHPVPGRHLRHHPPETAQARRKGHHLGAPDQGRARLGLPVSPRVRPRPSAPRALHRPAARPHHRLSRAPALAVPPCRPAAAKRAQRAAVCRVCRLLARPPTVRTPNNQPLARRRARPWSP
jgi:hypothetical protein